MTATKETSPAPPTPFPTTRYQGSKRKLAHSIVRALSDLDFTTALDAFGGTGAIAHALKLAGKHVTYNDALAFNHQIGLALIENDGVQLEESDLQTVGLRQAEIDYDDFVERTFDDVYFTREENRWLDVAAQNIARVTDVYKRAMLFFCLFQSAASKRPYNLFHRKNLYMRTANVDRSFGNKTTWERPFREHFARFAREANRAIIDGSGTCRATCRDAMTIADPFDLIYIDPPYVSSTGVGVDYHHFYHFLEGIVRYEDWPALIDETSKHKRLNQQDNPWCDPARNTEMFRALFARFRESILVVSYRSDGTPTIDALRKMLEEVKKTVRVIEGETYQYALSTNRRSREVLLIAE